MSNDTRTQERIEQAVAAHLDSCTPERYAYIMKHLGPWTDGYLARDAEPTTVTAEQINELRDNFFTLFYLEDHEDVSRSVAAVLRILNIRIEGDEA